MGGYDNNCAICGAIVKQLIHVDDDDIDQNANEDVEGVEDDSEDDGEDRNEDENDNDGSEGNEEDQIEDVNDQEDDNNEDEEEDNGEGENEDNDDDDEGYDKSLIKVEDVLWMNDVRVMSENREALSMNK